MQHIMEDLRWPVASVTLKAAQANLPFGAGFGTFVPVYQTVEPRTLLFERYVNRAHNDWLELGLEGGVLTIVGLVVFFVWFGRSSFQVWRPGQSGADALDTALARAGSIVVVLLLLHSIVDYPLRTTAMMVVFALACALLINPIWVSKSTPGDTEWSAKPLRGARGRSVTLDLIHVRGIDRDCFALSVLGDQRDTVQVVNKI